MEFRSRCDRATQQLHEEALALGAGACGHLVDPFGLGNALKCVEIQAVGYEEAFVRSRCLGLRTR